MFVRGECKYTDTASRAEAGSAKVKKSAPGPDRVTTVDVKSALRDEEKFSFMLNFLNLCSVLGLPEGFANARVTLLPKTENSTQPSQNRSVSATNHVFKVQTDGK